MHSKHDSIGKRSSMEWRLSFNISKGGGTLISTAKIVFSNHKWLTCAFKEYNGVALHSTMDKVANFCGIADMCSWHGIEY